MKLHLSLSLRKALLACVLAVAPCVPSVATGTALLASGLVAFNILSSQAKASTVIAGDLTGVSGLSSINLTINPQLTPSTESDLNRWNEDDANDGSVDNIIVTSSGILIADKDITSLVCGSSGSLSKNITANVVDYTISGDIYGACLSGSYSGDVYLSIQSTSIGGDVILGNYDGTYTGSSYSLLSLLGSQVTGSVYGASLYGEFSGTSSLSLIDSSVGGDVIGGLLNGDYSGSSSISISSLGMYGVSLISGDVVAGNADGSFEGATRIDIGGGSILGSVYGGNLSGYFNGESFVYHSGGTVSGDIYAGNQEGDFSGKSRVFINSSLSGSVYGGSENGNYYGVDYWTDGLYEQEYTTQLVVWGGTITESVYGGNADGYFSGELVIGIYGGTISGSVYGGNEAGYFAGDTTIKIEGGSIIGSLYGGSKSGDFTSSSITIVIEGEDAHIGTGSSESHFIGGAVASSDTVVSQGTISISLIQGTLESNLYAAGEAGALDIISTESTNVTIHSSFNLSSGLTISGDYYSDVDIVSLYMSSDEVRTLTLKSDESNDATTNFGNLNIINFDEICIDGTDEICFLNVFGTKMGISYDTGSANKVTSKTGTGSWVIESSGENCEGINVDAGTLVLDDNAYITAYLEIASTAIIDLRDNVTIHNSLTLCDGATVYMDKSAAVTAIYGDIADTYPKTKLVVEGQFKLVLDEALSESFTKKLFYFGAGTSLDTIEISEDSYLYTLANSNINFEYKENYTHDLLLNSQELYAVLASTYLGDYIEFEDGTVLNIANLDGIEDENDYYLIFADQALVLTNELQLIDSDGGGVVTVTHTWIGTTGVWDDSTSNWLSGFVPLETSTIYFSGEGSFGVELEGDKVVAIVNVSEADYTFTGDSLTTEKMNIDAVTLTLENNVTVTGELDADDANIVNDGVLSIGDGSAIADLSGEGQLIVLQDAYVSIDSLAQGGVTIQQNAQLNLGSANLELANFASAGNLATSGSVNITSQVDEGGNISASSLTIQAGSTFGALTVSTLVIDGELSTEYSALALNSLTDCTFELTGLDSILEEGTYTIIEGSENLTWENLTFSEDMQTSIDALTSANMDLEWLVEDDSLKLVVTSIIPSPEELIWTGGMGSADSPAIWDDSTSNWDLGQTPGAGTDVNFNLDGDCYIAIQGAKRVEDMLVTGSSLLLSLSGDSLTVNSLTTTADLEINNAVTVKGEVTLEGANMDVSSSGTVTAEGITLSADSKLTNSGELYVTGAINATVNIDNTGSLTVGDGTNILSLNSHADADADAPLAGSFTVLADANVSVGAIAQESITLQSGASLSISAESTSVVNLNNAGQISSTGDLAVTSITTDGGDVEAAALSIQAGSIFGDLTVESLMIDGALSTSTAALTVDSVTSAEPVSLDVTGLTSDLAEGTYTIVTGAAGLTWDAFALSDSMTSAIDAMIAKDWFVMTTESGDSLKLLVYVDAPRAWYTSTNDSIISIDGGQAIEGSEIALFTNAETGAIVSYENFADLTSIYVDADALIDLSLSPAPSAGEKLQLANVTGDQGATLSIKGSGADEHAATLLYSASSITENSVAAEGITLNVENTGEGTITLSSVSLVGATMIISDGTSLNLMSLTANDASIIQNLGSLTLNDGTDVDSTFSGYGSMTIAENATVAIGGLESSDLTLESGSTLSISGDVTLLNFAGSGTLSMVDNTLTLGASSMLRTVPDETSEGGNVIAKTIIINDDRILGDVTITDSLTVDVAGSLTVNSLNSDNEDALLTGDVEIQGSGGEYLGTYDASTVTIVTEGASQVLATSEELSIVGSAGTIALVSTDGTSTVNSITTSGTNLDLSSLGSSSLQINTTSTIDSAVIVVGFDAENFVNSSAAQLVFTGADVILKDSVVVLTALSDDSLSVLKNLDNTDDVAILDLGDNVTIDGELEVAVVGTTLQKYIKSASFNSDGELIVDVNTSFYEDAVVSGNGVAGITLVKSAYDQVDPQANAANYKDLAAAMDSLDDMIAAGDNGSVNKLASAIAGASTVSLGSALMSDVERQLRSSRNRASGLQYVAQEGSGFGAWIVAESNFDSLGNTSGNRLGHSLDSYGGSVGADFSVSKSTSLGLSYTMMYGDLSANGVDYGEGSLDTQYLSLYGQTASGNWIHNYAMSFGWGTAEMDRNVYHANGYYCTEGESDTTAFGLLYELGYKLNPCWQIVANASLQNSTVDAYKERGSDAGLSVGKQESTWATFGLGAQLDTDLGEGVVNRTCQLSTRAILKFYAGDTGSSADVTLLSGSDAATVRGTDAGSVAIEFSAGLVVPVSSNGGDVFVDAAVQLRDEQSSVNVSAGYRFTF